MRKLLSVLSSTLQGGIRGGFLILALLATSPLWASYSFKLGNLYYYIKNANEVTVTDANDARSITIPRTVTYDSITYIVTRIGDAAFYDCSSLTSINIPNSVTSIGYAAFCGCSSLTSIALPEGVTSVENRTFQFCSSLTSITLPNSVTSIGHNAFDDCSNLTSITIPNNVTSIGSAVFQGCSSLTSITIPNSVTSIGSHAFNLCSSLTSITIPEGVASIGERTFYACSSLASITIPNSITSIGSNAFYDCSSLTSITIPNSVTSIGDYAFYNCSSLTSITIPEGVTSIGSSVFDDCSALTSITIPEGVMSIGSSAFSGCSSLTSIALPEGVTSIGDYAFCDCSSLTSITIPNSVTSIGHNAFDDCSNLTSITIPNNVTSIESAVFQDCSSLTSVTIPNSVTSIGKSAFNLCSALTSITIPEGVTSIGNYAFQRCSSLTSINIPDSVTSIGNYAFRYCYSLTSINIPNSITSIGEGTFYGCSSLTSATIGNSVTSIGAEAFYCVNLEEIYCYPTTPPAVTSEPTFLYYNATLYVPCDSKEAYEEHPVFGEFKNIKGIDDCGGGFVTTHIHDTICQGEVYEFGEYLCDTTGTYTAIIGDVTTFLYLTVLPSSIDTITVEACDSYEWHGKVYTESGVYTYSDPYNPCVIEELHLTIIDTPTPPEPEIPTEGIGVFSIGEGKTVTFSRGNLQYTQSTDTWSFAENQYDYIGTDNVTGGSVSSDPIAGDSKEGTALADKIDLFGWSTSTTKFGVSTSAYSSDYSGSFVDWGTNQIGADAPNTWRTLTCNEWEYLLNNRPNANSLKGVAQVNGVNGLILLPDSWTCPSGVTFKSGFHNNYGVEYYAAYQTFTADQWSKLESAGAVFLPASGYRYGSDVYVVQIYGDYWSATEDGSNYADCLYFHSDGAGMSFNSRYYGRSVRLVKDVNSTTPEPPVEPETEEIFIYQPVDSVTICASELPYIWMGMEFTAAGMFISEEIAEDENYIYHYIYTLELTVIPFSSDTIVVEAYDSYEWHGKVYTESGTYIYGIYENFCSIEVLELTIIDTPTPPEPEIPTEGIGVFSVGEGKTVTFSPGNLQYTQSTNTWSFAENQYDYIGTDNVTGGSVSSDPTYGDGTALADKIDLFGWSASNTTAPFGVSTSTDYNDYSGSFVDWGTNQIGTDAPNTWRTLTYDEWKYLRFTRTNANALCGVAQVNGVNGLVFLPDNWTCPEGVTFKSGFHSGYGEDYYAEYQTFTADQWLKLEFAGAVFLPAAGGRYGSGWYDLQLSGYYWSATERNSNEADKLYFYSFAGNVSSSPRYDGHAVRLIKDISNTTPEPPVEPQDTTIYHPTEYATICEGTTFVWMGMEFTEIGTYTYEEIVEDENYIYHYIHTLELQVIAPPEPDTIVVEAYDSYEWHGRVYTESGTYFYEEWCYQEILELTIIPSEDKEYVYGTYQQDLVCNGYIYVDPITGENHLISSLDPTSLIWSDTVKGTEVDTIHTFHIIPIVYPEPLTEDMLYAIGAVPKLVAGEKVDLMGTTELIMAYYQMVDQHDIADVIGVEWVLGHDVVLDAEQTTHTMVLEVWTQCDDIIPMEFTFPVSKKDSEPQDTTIYIYHLAEYATICEGETLTWMGMEYTETGTYTYAYEEIVEEDDYIYHYHHIFTLDLTVLPYETIEYEVEAYDSYVWHNIVYTESGTYTYQYECTTEVLYLTIIPSEDNQGEVVVEPSTNSVTITWQKEDDADTYIIVIKQGDKVVCTLIFDAEGNLVSVNYLPGRESNKHGIQHAGLTSDSFQYTITGLTPSTDYTYTVTATDDSDNTISSYSGEFTTQTATSVENTNSQSPISNCQKILYEDHIYILRDGKTYTIMGAEVK